MARGYLSDSSSRKEEIITYIEELMVRKHMTQGTLARRIGKSQSSLSKKFVNQSFNLGELIEIFGILDAEPEKVGKLMILKK